METTPPQTPPTEPLEAPSPRRLTRAAGDRYFGGVAGGMARYFGIDPVITRIAFVVTTLAGGFGILAYVLAWIFVPAEPGERTYQWRNGDRSGRAILGRVAFAILVVTVIVIAMVAVGLASAIGGAAAVASIVIVCGVAAAAGALSGGRGRWLVLPAILIALPAGIVAAADLDVRGGVGEREYRPATVSALQDRYELGMGELRIDLRDLDLPAGDTTIDARVGIGHLLVLVPEGLCVQPSVEVGAGYAGVLDRDSAGLDVALDERMDAAPQAPRLILDAELGMGAVEVTDDENRYFDHDDDTDGNLARDGALAKACAGSR